ncbi:metallophosphoesterase, partial [Bacillus sp. SIMBA_033]
FAFIHVLDELALKNIKLIALPGDFTDDGQPINVRALAEILRRYQKKYGMRFFAIPGNHDPVKPFSSPAGKADFLTSDGNEFGL